MIESCGVQSFVVVWHAFVISRKISLVNYQKDIFLLTSEMCGGTLIGADGSQKEMFAPGLNLQTHIRR